MVLGTWNEANIGYWRGTPEEFRKLHDYAIDGVRRALPTARVGGPDTAGSGGQWMRDFLEHQLRGRNFATGQIGTPIDFVSFHAKGRPVYVDGHVRMGIANQLATIDEGFRIIASYPEVKAKPIVIGESDPEGCAACQGPQLQYLATRQVLHHTAASFARKHALAEAACVTSNARPGPSSSKTPRSSPVPRLADQRHHPSVFMSSLSAGWRESNRGASDGAIDLDGCEPAFASAPRGGAGAPRGRAPILPGTPRRLPCCPAAHPR